MGNTIKLARPRYPSAWVSRDRWSGSNGAVRDDVMREINSLPQVLRPLSADEVIVRGALIMNDLSMHESPLFIRRFDAAAVAQTVPLVRGKPLLANHTTVGMDGLPLGRFFRAELEQRPDGSTWMAALFFMLNDEQGQAIARKIDGGIISENSPTVEFDRIYCSVCGEDDLACDHVRGLVYDGKKCEAVMTSIADFWEGSLVWAGQQKGTAFRTEREPSRAGLYVAAGRESARLVDADQYLASLTQRRQRSTSWVSQSERERNFTAWYTRPEFLRWWGRDDARDERAFWEELRREEIRRETVRYSGGNRMGY